MKSGYLFNAEKSEWSSLYAYDYKPVNEKNSNQHSMPNLNGLGLKDALYLLEDSGIESESKRKR